MSRLDWAGMHLFIPCLIVRDEAEWFKYIVCV